MLRATTRLKQDFKALGKAERGFRFWRKKDVLVGIPQEEDSVREDGVTNAELMYIHSYGSPINSIPARPTIEPAIEKNRVVIAQILRGGMAGTLTGNLASGDAALKRAGTFAVAKAKEMFGSSELAPNAPSTIRMKGSSAPLIDTGQLRNAITFVIRRK